MVDLTPWMVTAKKARPIAAPKGVPIHLGAIATAAAGGAAGLAPLLLVIWWAPWWLSMAVLLAGVGAGVWMAVWRRNTGLRQKTGRVIYDWASAGENRLWYCGHDVTRPPDQGLVQLVNLLKWS